jgi:transcriptional regulator with XRE-family HTH domain
MARAALDWTTRDLAERARVGITTVNRFEKGARVAIPATLAAMRHALEQAGVEFLNGDGARLRPHST